MIIFMKKAEYLVNYRLLISLILLIASTSLFAAPNGKELLTACEESLNHGFTGAQGMMCTWYVTPCDCSRGENSEIPRVCLPLEPDIDVLAREVTKGLKVSPELLDKNADLAAALILEIKYPCTE